MAKTVIVSDSHLRHKYIDEILAWESPYDKLIFTGDVFDQFNDTPAQNREAAIWLKQKLQDPKNIMIFGNHDWSYRWPNNFEARCSGFDELKSIVINNELTQKDWNKLHLYHISDNILFSHAGLDRDWFYYTAKAGFEVPIQLTLPNIFNWLDVVKNDIYLRFSAGKGQPLMGAGKNRGGEQAIGGIIWQDFGVHIPIAGIGQIVGHTPQNINKGPLFRFINHDKTPMWRFAYKGINPEWLKNGWTLCMDTHNRHYIIIENEKLIIKSVFWDKQSLQTDYTISQGETVCEINLNDR